MISFIWILVTLITDWKSVFYRKAIIYKRRIDDELEKRRMNHKQSFASQGTNSHINDAGSSVYNKEYGMVGGTIPGGVTTSWDTVLPGS